MAVLHAKKNSPSILFGAGVVSMVGSTVLACRATLKLDDTLSEVEYDLKMAREMYEVPEEEGGYSSRELKRKTTYIYFRCVGKVAKLYVPSVVAGGIGIACLTKSHNILQDRNAALTAAYVAVDSAFNRYRARVRAEYGEELDQQFMYETEEIQVIDGETGEVVTTTRITGAPGAKYARWFDSRCSAFSPDFDRSNWMFLRQQQLWVNDLLKMRGHVFLNEVYERIGLRPTDDGAIVGWVYDPHNDLGRDVFTDTSDNYIDFGCWDQSTGDPLPMEMFENGEEGAILLNFNVDGPIYGLIDRLEAIREAQTS
jgi:hypothetical protein